MRTPLSGLILAVCLLSGCLGVPSYYDIGVVHRTVTTRSPAAQLWFDRGLALTYGFNHEEAIRCFDRAIELDPYCAMAYWGKFYALGSELQRKGVALRTCGGSSATGLLRGGLWTF
jgi:tetratricopeptide (TPR) repeat protein